jgi:hypothetical protein
VLSIEKSVQCLRWPKEDHEDDHPGWDDIVRQLDSSRDVLLYPYDEAISAELFDWTMPSSIAHEFVTKKKRLIVLEGSWEGAKTMANRITTIRQRLCLPPLPSVTLPAGITSHYWRLQHMGSGAVSTIEAIAHVISIIETIERDKGGGGVSEERSGLEISPEQKRCRYEEMGGTTVGSAADTLLLLFNLQRCRMLSSVQKGGKVPIAIAASNNSGFTTSWTRIIANAKAGGEDGVSTSLEKSSS